MPERGPTSLPGATPATLGVINLRGAISRVIDVRLLLGYPTSRQQLASLTQLLADRERDHVGWLDELRRCVDNDEPFTKATDPAQCAFGKWYNAVHEDEGKRFAITGGADSLDRLLDAFDAPHRRIHGIAQHCLALAGEGKQDEARAVIEQAWTTDLAEMKRLFKSLLNNFVSARRPMLVFVESGNDRLALAVDRLLDIATLEPTPQTRHFDHGRVDLQLNTAFTSENELVQILDLDELIALDGATDRAAA